LAERDLLEGNPGAARARLESLLDRPGMREIHATMLMPLLAWAYLDLDEGALAEEMAAQSIARATDETYQLALGDALRIQALVATRHGRYAEAESAVEGALALAEAMPYPYAKAKALYVRAQLHVSCGELGPGREQLHEALVIVARLGERLYAEKIEHVLTERS